MYWGWRRNYSKGKCSLKLDKIKTEYCVVQEEEFSLSGEAMTGLLQAALDRRVPFKFKARGFSMSPFIKDGDVITISPLIKYSRNFLFPLTLILSPKGRGKGEGVSSYSIGFGKPVAFIHSRTGKLIVHRVIGRCGDNYLIKGDRSTELDGLIPSKNILGVVTRVERGDRKVRIGMGLERYIIVFLSRTRILSCLAWVWKKIR